MADKTVFIDQSYGRRERARLDDPLGMLEERLHRLMIQESGNVNDFSSLEEARALIKSLVFDDLDRDNFQSSLNGLEKKEASSPIRIAGVALILRVSYWYNPANEIAILDDVSTTLSH